MPKVVPEYKEQARKRIMDAASAEFAKKGDVLIFPEDDGEITAAREPG